MGNILYSSSQQTIFMYDDNLPRYYHKTYRCVFDMRYCYAVCGRALRGGCSGTTHVETLACTMTTNGWTSHCFLTGVCSLRWHHSFHIQALHHTLTIILFLPFTPLRQSYPFVDIHTSQTWASLFNPGSKLRLNCWKCYSSSVRSF
jgi:hypothetical protein